MVSSAGLENGAERGVARGSPVAPVFALKSPAMGYSWCLRLLFVLKVSHGFKCKSIPLSSLMLKEAQIVSCTGVGSVWPAASSANKVVFQHVLPVDLRLAVPPAMPTPPTPPSCSAVG